MEKQTNKQTLHQVFSRFTPGLQDGATGQGIVGFNVKKLNNGLRYIPIQDESCGFGVGC